MPSLRDYLGSRCPHCSNDILQQLPSTNRMPGQEVAWCAACDRRYSVEELARGVKGPSLFARVFGKPHRA